MRRSSVAGRVAKALIGTTLVLQVSVPVTAQERDQRVELSLHGDVRWFQFQALESVPGSALGASDEHSERGAFRLKFGTRSKRWSTEVHGLLEGASPTALVGGFGLSGERRSSRYFDWQGDVDRSQDRQIVADIDRANVRYQNDVVRITVGRQAVTWGVNYFWPVLDLFSAFSPERIDRDYKPGVDAARVTVPVGQFSEIELIGAVQGPETRRDRSYGVLGRFHLGSADLGLMVGDFHHDRVLGAFLAGSVRGTGLRGELAHTETSQLARQEGDPERFLRATAGVDRLLSPTVSLVFEAHWNEIGASRPEQFLSLSQRDRVRRGEITSLSRWSSGLSLSWQTSPLLSLNASLLANLEDGSLLLQPSGARSLSNNADLLFGAIVGFGDEPRAGQRVGSEYGSAVTTVWVAFKASF